MNSPRLPKVLASSVIRTANPGEAHGGLYVVDLEAGTMDQVVNWDTQNISFHDRGAERGLRGISFHGGRAYVCADDKVMIYDSGFRNVGEIANAYFGDLHETVAADGMLWVSSSAFDSVIGIDLASGRCVAGYCLRNDRDRVVKKALWKAFGLKRPAGAKLARFDPEAPDGPRRDDVIHLNTVSRDADGRLLVAAHRGVWLYAIDGNRLTRRCRIPFKAHNTQPFGDGYILCDTEGNCAVRIDAAGRKLAEYRAVTYPDSEMSHTDLPRDFARAGFVRGLCSHGDDLIIAGCSPATVMAFSARTGELVNSVNLSMDVRNAVHGLEIFPD